MIRKRTDGQLSKDEYDHLQENYSSPPRQSGFSQASPGTLLTRRIVPTRASAYLQHRRSLNVAFIAALRKQQSHALSESWLENCREYTVHASEIERKYGRTQGFVWTFGNGDCGQLAHGVESDKDMNVKFPRQVSNLNAVHVTRVSCGGLHTAAITSVGEVYTWGCNDDGALGRKTGESSSENLPALVSGIPAGTIVNHVVAGDCHTAVCTTDGKVITWGSYKDKDGKPWCDSTSAKASFKSKQSKPYYISQLSNIVDLACGDTFNIALTDSGEVWSWGLGEMGQLGRPVTNEIKIDGEYQVDTVYRQHLTPGKMMLNDAKLPAAKAIGCGAYHTLVSLTSVGTLYSTGLNNYGQLGIGSSTDDGDNSMFRSSLTLVEALVDHNVVQADGGAHYSIVRTSDGKVYTFGRGDYGQLGIEDNGDPEFNKAGFFVNTPQLVNLKNNGDVRVCMISSGSSHALALTESNEVYSWGYGDMLALGNGKAKDERTPKKVDWSQTSFGNSKVLQVEAGGQHSAVLARK